MQGVSNVSCDALGQGANDKCIQEPNHTRACKIDEKRGTKLFDALFKGLGQNPHHPETQHRPGELEGEVDLVIRMRVAEITRLFRPSLNKKPKQSHIHKNSREL